MGKIVAIGGGEIGRPGYPIETLEIDQEIIKLTGKQNPKLLFLPTASGDSEGYVEVVKSYFGTNLGCHIDTLLLIKNSYSQNEIEDKILNSDIVYVGGGNTLKMMKLWRKYGVDKILWKAYHKGVVLSGVSAGSICWFNYGNSDSRKSINPDAAYIKVKGLGIIKALHCPHYDTESLREIDLKRMMKTTTGVAIALDNCCALSVVDNKYKLIKSKTSANAYKFFWKKGEYTKQIIETNDYLPIEQLLKK